MAKFNLAPDEVVILTNSNVNRKGHFGTHEIVLTNHNLVAIKKGFFGNTKDISYFPLATIKMYEGKAQAIARKGWAEPAGFDVYFINNQESFEFQASNKKEAAKWVESIINILAGTKTQQTTKKSDGGLIANALKSTLDSFKDALGIEKDDPSGDINIEPVFDNLVQNPQQHPNIEMVAKKCVSCSAPISGFKGDIIRCQYCNSDQQL